MSRAAALAPVAVVAAIAAPAAKQALAERSGGAVAQVTVLSSTDAHTKTGTGWQALRATTVTVPPGEEAFVLVRFTAAAACEGTGQRRCDVRVKVGSQLAEPSAVRTMTLPIVGRVQTDGGVPFATVQRGGTASHAFEAVAGPLPPGTHHVRLEWSAPGGTGSRFRLPFGYVLVVERVAA